MVSPVTGAGFTAFAAGTGSVAGCPTGTTTSPTGAAGSALAATGSRAAGRCSIVAAAPPAKLFASTDAGAVAVVAGVVGAEGFGLALDDVGLDAGDPGRDGGLELDLRRALRDRLVRVGVGLGTAAGGGDFAQGGTLGAIIGEGLLVDRGLLLGEGPEDQRGGSVGRRIQNGPEGLPDGTVVKTAHLRGIDSCKEQKRPPRESRKAPSPRPFPLRFESPMTVSSGPGGGTVSAFDVAHRVVDGLPAAVVRERDHSPDDGCQNDDREDDCEDPLSAEAHAPQDDSVFISV
jgi:hypothetical protein